MARKQSKARKLEVFWKGKVTPTHIALIVDRYLCDNNFSSTRSTFKNEASSLISHSPIHVEQKVMLDRQQAVVEQEKKRVQMLLQGMHNVMTAYNASGNILAPTPTVKSAVVAVSQPTLGYKSQPGNPTFVQNKSNALSLPQSNNSNAEGGNFSTPTLNVSDRKRKDTKVVDASSTAKKPCGGSSNRKVVSHGHNVPQQSDKAVNNTIAAQPSAIQSSSENCIPRESQVQGSNVAKCLFNQSTTSVPSNSPVPKTPPITKSSHSDTHICKEYEHFTLNQEEG